MLVLYVVGLPAVALFSVWRVQKRAHERLAKIETLKGHMTWGLFYSAYDPKVWWWESTVTLRKIVIAFIGVFGTEMGEMQVHLTAFLIVCVIVLTAVVRPFGERVLLQYLEMGTLLATWATLWAGTVFNTYPRCEDDKVGGTTVAWCDSLSIAIGLLDIGMVVAVIAVVVYYTKQDQCNACCLRLWNKSVGKRRLAKRKREADGRRSRMDSTEVTSFVNPQLDIEMIEKTPELSVELTIVTNSENVEVEMIEME